MTDRNVVSGRRKRQSLGHARVKLLVVLLFTATAVITWQFARRRPDPGISYSASDLASAPAGKSDAELPGNESAESTGPSAGQGLTRPVYPYSVVPGGVQSVSELKRIMEHDPVVARQFQGFDFAHAHLVQVSEKQGMYVSYRIGQKVYWTRKKVWLHPGETLISDGRMTARTRCGNRVAKAPLDPGSPLEPPQEQFDDPYSAMIAVPTASPALTGPPSAAPAVPMAAAAKKWWMLPLLAAPLAALPHSGTASPDPLAVTPEPGTTLLIVSGLAGVYWRSRKHRRKK